MFGLGNIFGSFGTIPDILMGKDPKDALLDNLKTAAVVGTGMALGPGLLAAAPEAAAAGTAAEAAAPAAMVTGGSGLPISAQAGAEMASSLNAAGYGQSGSGLLSTMKDAASAAKPIGQAAMAANSVKGLLTTPQQPIQASPVMQGGGGAQGLAQLANGIEQQQAQQRQLDAQAMAARRKVFGGGYGLA